ncbi:hypothetical protein [Armatimonas sp.]|uniref:hypothetical protein n=1 Tax=Armatimonas sp. TaxID=1872638 RepID=UPI00286D22C3|nr:hypothetical protein [Armatimonas sp.]
MIELIVAIATLAVLSAILSPLFSRGQSRRVGAVAAAGTMAMCLTALPTQAQGLPDIWSGRAKCTIENRALGSAFGMHFIATYAESPTSLLTYYISNNANGSATGLAITRDGINFTNMGVVLTQGPNVFDNRLASFPGVAALDGSRIAMVYEAAGKSSSYPGDIGLALSSNGRQFTKDPSPILVHARRQPGDANLNLNWERNNIGTPSLVVVGNTRYLFYHGFGKSWESGSPDDCQVGVAVGTDLRNMTRYSGNPIIKTGARGTWDSGSIGRRSIQRGSDGWWYLVYEGSTDQPYDRASWSTGLARSRDLLNWQKFSGNPILPRTASGFGYDGPELVLLNGRTYIYFRNGATYRAIVSWR